MTNKIANVAITTVLQDRPVGVGVGGFKYAMLLDNVEVDSVTKPTEVGGASFSILAPGNYSFSCVRVSDTGEAISPLVTSAVVVVGPDQILVPLSVTVALAEALVVPETVVATV